MISLDTNHSVLATSPNPSADNPEWNFDSTADAGRIMIFNEKGSTGNVSIIHNSEDGSRTDVQFTPTIEQAHEIMKAAIAGAEWEKAHAKRNA